MDFICSVGVPDDQLAVLRCRDEVSSVGGPVHGVDFGQVTFECPLCFEVEARQWFSTLSGDFAHYGGGLVADESKREACLISTEEKAASA